MRKIAILTLFTLLTALLSTAQQPNQPPSNTDPSASPQQNQPDYTPPADASPDPQQNPQPSPTQPAGTVEPQNQDPNAPVLNQRDSTNNANVPMNGNGITIASGTEIQATLDGPLSTKTNHVGDQFTATITQPVRDVDSNVVIPAGSKIHGEVSEAEQGKALPELRGKGRLNLRFRDIELRNGGNVPLLATLTSVNQTGKSDKQTGSEGEVQSSRSGTETAKDVGIGAAIGTVGGLIFGSALKGLAIGAIAGGGYVLATKGKDVELPAETGLKLRVDEPINVPAGMSNADNGSGVR